MQLFSRAAFEGSKRILALGPIQDIMALRPLLDADAVLSGASRDERTGDLAALASASKGPPFDVVVCFSPVYPPSFDGVGGAELFAQALDAALKPAGMAAIVGGSPALVARLRILKVSTVQGRSVLWATKSAIGCACARKR